MLKTEILLQVFKTYQLQELHQLFENYILFFWYNVHETSTPVFPWEFRNILIFGVLIPCVQCVIHIYSRYTFNWDALFEISQHANHTTARNEILKSSSCFVPSCSIITSFMQNRDLIKIVVLRLMLILLFHIICT